MKIDLFYFNENTHNFPEWHSGDTYIFSIEAIDTVSRINEKAFQIDADWILFWDATIGKPDTRLVTALTNSKCDTWHAGLKLGLAGLPVMIDYINPAWIYNKDADSSIISSSFRLSIRACLIKTDVFKKMNGLSTRYKSIEIAGLALGYTIIKQGGIIRYHPQLVLQQSKAKIAEIDEWTFLRQFYSKKWHYWVLFNQKGIFKNYRNWRRTKSVKYTPIKPSLHISDRAVEDIVTNTNVSVLAPTLDRYEYLRAELEQLSKQIIIPYEVLITDQTDKDRKQYINNDKYPKLDIKYFPQDEKGQCIAWNKLLEEAKGEYVLFLGDDADNIRPDFIARLLNTMFAFDADIAASHVIEMGASSKEINHHYYMSDTFPITLAKKEVVMKAGGMDMFFNKNIRADYDLALRCHENGALMIFDSSALILHHRAPIGGLRAHKARVITNAIAKRSILKFAEPTASEIFLVKKYFSKMQFRNFIRIKYFEQLMVRGGLFKRFLRLIVFAIRVPAIKKRYKENLNLANKELDERGILRY